MAKVKLPFGLQGDRLLSVGEVERGLACDCVCPACRQPLVARKGNDKIHHFSHYQGADCGYGLESALHYEAKRILSAAGRIMLPGVYIPNRRSPVFPGRMLYIDQLWMERRIGKLVPDLLLQSGRRRLLLEIAVTHPSGEEKIRRIREMGYAALEVDLRDLLKILQTLRVADLHRVLVQRLVYRRQGKSWLFNPRRNALEVALRRAAIPRKVYYRRFKNRHYYTVRPCPAGKRTWEVSIVRRYNYASVFQDCMHCIYCSEIRYLEVYRGYRTVPTIPEEVWCWGEQPNLIEMLTS